MGLNTQEHIDIIAVFEKTFKGNHNKEPKELWAIGHVYQNKEMNDAFIAFRWGWSAAACYHR